MIISFMKFLAVSVCTCPHTQNTIVFLFNKLLYHCGITFHDIKKFIFFVLILLTKCNRYLQSAVAFNTDRKLISIIYLLICAALAHLHIAWCFLFGTIKGVLG